MLTTFTNPTIYDVTQDLVPLPKITTHIVQSLNKFFGQPDDGLLTGPKTCTCILCIAANCNIFMSMTVCAYRYMPCTALSY